MLRKNLGFIKPGIDTTNYNHAIPLVSVNEDGMISASLRGGCFLLLEGFYAIPFRSLRKNLDIIAVRSAQSPEIEFIHVIWDDLRIRDLVVASRLRLLNMNIWNLFEAYAI